MIVLTPGVTVVAAGVVSGLCFILINGLRRGKSAQSDKDSAPQQALDDTRCVCCLKPFVIGRGVQCGECSSRACRKGCSRWDSEDNCWHCLFCHQRRLWLRRNDKWFETFGGYPADSETAADCFRTAKSQVLLGGAEYAGVDPGVALAAGADEDGDSVERVRELVEKIVDGLVGNVDESTVGRLYDHAAYDQLMDNYKQPLAGALARLAVSLHLAMINKPAAREPPTMAHAALRDLVDRAVDEARKLPGLGAADAERSDRSKDVADQTYEDLLATAILNKVIEKHQNERIDGNRNHLHEKKIFSKQKYITSEIEVGLDEGVEEGSSSLEPLSQDEYSSDCSVPVQNYSRSRQEPLSLTIEEHIEEVTTTYTSDEERDNDESGNSLDFRNARRVPFPEFGMDIIDPSQDSSEETQDEAPSVAPVDLVTPVESWEQNWLFQKKKIQAQAEPVSMLVPNPSHDFRPLIGDQEAEDTSDLSECSAESDEEIEEELFEAINNVIPKPATNANVENTLLLRGDENVSRTGIRVTSHVAEIHEDGLERSTTTITEKHIVEDSGADDVSAEKRALDEVERRQNNGHVVLEDEDAEEKLKIESIAPETLVCHIKDEIETEGDKVKHRRDIVTEFIRHEKSANVSERRNDVVNIIETVGRSVNRKREQRVEQEREIANKLDELSPDEHSDSPRVAEIESEIEVDTIVENGSEVSRGSDDLKLALDEDKIQPVQPIVAEVKPDSREVVETKPVDETPSSTEFYHVTKTELINLDDDLDVQDLPRTPIPSTTSSSPNELESSVSGITIRTDLSTLDQKLGSIESRIDERIDALNGMLDNRGDDTKEVLNKIQNLVEFHRDDEANVDPPRENQKRHSSVTEITLSKPEAQHEDGVQQESEYTEHYATATQRHMDSLTRSLKDDISTFSTAESKETAHDQKTDSPPPIPSTPPPIARLRTSREFSAFATVNIGETETADKKKVEMDVILATPPRPGTIAEREHKKWETALPIENNPYSEENIQKRLWQRQYTRRVSAEISGASDTELPTTTGAPLQVILGAGQPDYKRYGRDYYINDAKNSSGIRPRRSANNGRPNSSLSQNSSLHDDDLEPQEQIEYQQESAAVPKIDAETGRKVAMWQQNNIYSVAPEVEVRSKHRVETTIQLGSAPQQLRTNEMNAKADEISIVETENSWEERKTEEFLENERRNSKNEMNAKLNNQEEPQKLAALDARRSSLSDSKKSINRLDLKAYGFDNEIKIDGNSVTTTKEKRVVNKLDLRSFGYDNEFQRNRFIRKIDTKLNNGSGKSSIIHAKTKSNLTEDYVEYEKSKSSHNLADYDTLDDYEKTKSSENLDRNDKFSDISIKFGRMMSAKSMPNVDKIGLFTRNVTKRSSYKDELDIDVSDVNVDKEWPEIEKELTREEIEPPFGRPGLWKSETLILAGETSDLRDLSSSEDEGNEESTLTTSFTEVLSKRDIFETTTDKSTSITSNFEDDLPMPSVKRLAQAFIKTSHQTSSAPPKVFKTSGNSKRDRPTTPEIHIVETPRQMHSLTARSISREFREGLRQIPNKMPSPPASHSIIESNTTEHQVKDIVSETDGNIDDTAVIAPGKLKNNLKFWEQLQKQT